MIGMFGYQEINDLIGKLQNAQPCQRKGHGFSFVKVCGSCGASMCMECEHRGCQCENDE